MHLSGYITDFEMSIYLMAQTYAVSKVTFVPNGSAVLFLFGVNVQFLKKKCKWGQTY